MVKFIVLAVQAIFQASMLSEEEQMALANSLQTIIIDFIGFSGVAISIIVPILLRKMIQSISSSKYSKEIEILKTYAKSSVQAAEQSIADGKGTEKLSYANAVLEEAAKTHGFKWATPSVMKALIEAEVYVLKSIARKES